MRWPRDKACARLVVVLALACCACISGAHSQIDDRGQDVAAPARDLYLEVFINGASTDLIGAFHVRADGSFAIAPDELREIGLLAPHEALESDGLVSLDRLPGVEFIYDEPAQTIRVTADEAVRAPLVLDASGKTADTPVVADSGLGAVLNYTLFASTGGPSLSDIADFEGLSGAFDARLFSPLGTLSSSAIASTASEEPYGSVRLDTTWSYSDPAHLLTYTAGDLISGGLNWTRPVRLGGVQVQRNFQLRPDLVTLPLPSFAGSAAVPSTLEIYSDNGRLYSGSVPAGPFVARNLPVVAGGGKARVVLTDALGRETVSDLPFYAGSGLLRGGLYDFSVEAGFPRRSYGTASFDYARDWFASASLRHGIYDWLTLEGHAEGGESLVNAGAGVAFPLDRWGAGSLAFAGSATREGDTGILFNASIELDVGPFTVFGRTQRTFGDYRDIAAVSAKGSPFDALPARVLDQLSIGFPLSFDKGTLSFSGAHLERWNREPSWVASLSYSRPMPWHGSLFASTFVDLGDDTRFGGYVGFSMPLGAATSWTTGGESDMDGGTAFTEVSHAADLRAGSLGWRVRASGGERQELAAGATYRTGFARFDAGVAHSSAGSRATAQIEGAFVAAGGGVFVANRIDDAFAVVDVGAPGVDVLYENRPIGKTGRRGRVLLPALRSYEPNKVSIDPSTLPVDANVPQTEEMVVPADRSGVTVDFGVSTDVGSALVDFHGPDGAPLEAGSTGKLAGGKAFFVGYDGQAFIVGLADRNVATITQPDGTTCRAEFAFAREEGTQVHIEDVACVPHGDAGRASDGARARPG
jgi:outer membrane usher protein